MSSGLLATSRCTGFCLALALVAACSAETNPLTSVANDPSSPKLAGNTPLLAVMNFGNKDVGSPFPPPSGHDSSYHAKDKIRPGTVVIAAGGQVTFEVGAVHQVAIYEAGTTPDDIEVSPATLETSPGPAFIPDFVINNPDGRIFLGPALSFFSGHQTSFTFSTPGRYLVICTVTPHFVDARMYAWVIVK